MDAGNLQPYQVQNLERVLAHQASLMLPQADLINPSLSLRPIGEKSFGKYLEWGQSVGEFL